MGKNDYVWISVDKLYTIKWTISILQKFTFGNVNFTDLFSQYPAITTTTNFSVDHTFNFQI